MRPKARKPGLACRKESGATLAEAAAAADTPVPGAGEEGEQNASNRYSEHVAQPHNFARKFGHYKQHMSDANASEENSSTGDDSSRAGSSSVEDTSHIRERDWQAGLHIRSALDLLGKFDPGM